MVLVLGSMPAAQAAPPALTDPVKAEAIAERLGSDRTAGVYYRNDRVVVAVTDQGAAETVRNAGATPEVVSHSAAELGSAKARLDQLPGIPNTAWRVDQASNRVVVQVYDGVSSADRSVIEDAVSRYGDTVEITEHSGKIERSSYEMRGGVGITSTYQRSGQWWSTFCTAAFNVQNSSGKKYFLTAGHCLEDGYAEYWNRRSGDIPLGKNTANWEYGNDSNQSDYAVVEYTNANVVPYGTVQYRDGSSSQITRSASPFEGEKVKRVGTVSQDLDGMVLGTEATVTYDDGTTLRHMIEASTCDMHGDSGGALFSGETALGITSGGNYLEKPCGDTDGQADRSSWYEPVWRVLGWENLAVY
ncbi:S1 family peptidase [Streptomyces sp. NPDC090119]|uniref:S1 family peptidase n=1 Tax=Streptomyces sp. NPDC090119 TaxID=3365951 RepID=UPI00382E3538